MAEAMKGREDVVGMAVEVGSRAVVSHRRARICVACSDLDVAKIDSSVKHRGHEGLPQHVRVHPVLAHARDPGNGLQPSGGAVPVHPDSSAASEHRSVKAIVDRPVEGSTHSWWQRHEGDLVAFPMDTQNPVTAHVSDGVDVRAGCLENAQTKESEHGDQGEVVDVLGVTRRTDHRLKLQMAQTEGRRLWWDVGTADVLGRRVLKDPVDNAGPVEPTQHREPPRHSRGLQPPDLLHPT